jgi:uncharacterized protein
MDPLAHILLFAGMLLGLASIPFGFPGAAIILLCVFVYAAVTHFAAAVGVGLFALLCVLTLIAETADNWLTMVGARRYGASSGSMWLSFIGGIAGAIMVGAPFSFILGPLGPVAGGFFGAFAIVVAYEFFYCRNTFHEALAAGWGTLVGRMAGMVLKAVISVVMIIATAVAIGF